MSVVQELTRDMSLWKPQTEAVGVLIAANRRLIEEILYKMRRLEAEAGQQRPVADHDGV